MKINKKVLGILIAGSLSIGIVGCSKTNTDIPNPKEELKTEEKNKEVTDHKIGEVVNLTEDGSITTSVTNVRKISDGVYAVELELVNNSDKDLESDFINNYIVKDSKNYKCEQLLNQDIKGELMYDTIRPGDTLKGEIAYELKDGATPKTIEINLGLEYYTVFNLEK